MAIKYSMQVQCDRCNTQLSAKQVADSGGGLGGKPADPPVVLDGEGKPIEQPKPELEGVTAWRVNSWRADNVYCTACLLAMLAEVPCDIWKIDRIQV